MPPFTKNRFGSESGSFAVTVRLGENPILNASFV
jgi:hypothetical protein